MSTLRQIVRRLLPERFHPVMFNLRRQWTRSRQRQRLLGHHATAILTESRHGMLLVPAMDMEVGFRVAHSGDYGLSEVAFHSSYLTPQSNVLVVGTHVGTLLIPLAKRVASIVGIEANPDTFRLLSMNVRLNDLQNVELHNVAAGERNGDVEFLMHRCNTGASAILTGDLQAGKPWATFDDPQIATVPLRRLDDLLVERQFDLIIMDIEGAEYSALIGMSNILCASPRLQIELIPSLVESRSGVDAQAFAALLATHFPFARPLGNGSNSVTLRPTLPLVRDLLTRRRTACDLLLQKADV